MQNYPELSLLWLFRSTRRYQLLYHLPQTHQKPRSRQQSLFLNLLLPSCTPRHHAHRLLHLRLRHQRFSSQEHQLPRKRSNPRLPGNIPWSKKQTNQIPKQRRLKILLRLSLARSTHASSVGLRLRLYQKINCINRIPRFKITPNIRFQYSNIKHANRHNKIINSTIFR